MFKLEKEHKAGIISGLIATILFIYFLQPVLDWVSGVVVKILTLTGTAFLDRIYAQAAHLQTQDFAFVWLLFVDSFFSITFFIAGLIRLVGIDRLRTVFGHLSRNRPNENASMTYRIFSGLLLLSCGGFIIVIISANYIQLRTISSFQQHMRVIAPYIEENEEKMIYSRWSLMKSHADYELVYTTIRSKAQEHDIKLPENKIYTPSTL